VDSASSSLPRPGWSPLWIAPLVPLALGLVLSFALRREPSALVAPLLGPWAGLVFGHHECTMAVALPAWSAAACASGVAVLAAAVLLRRGGARGLIPFVATLWALLWVGLALLSVLNTLE
jgi:hypothetical protein